MKVLIVDDEPEAREHLAALLRAEADVQLVAGCACLPEVLALMAADLPDILFVDADLPGMGRLAATLTKNHSALPLVTLVSAVEAYPLAAFEVRALDCLLKPVAAEHVRRALGRAREQLERRSRPAAAGHLDRLAIKAPGRVLVLPLADVDWLEAAGNYLVVHTRLERHIVRATMASIDSRLDPARFLRIHRSRIVNIDRVKELQPLPSGDYLVVLQSGARLMSGRSYRERLRARLGFSRG